MTSWRTGPDIDPYAGSSQEGIDLLESASPAQLASAVPRVVIQKVDRRTGRPIDDVRPLMFDLVQTPQFGAMTDQDTFLERSTVSLQSIQIDSNLQLGFDVLRDVTLKFTVHRPDLIFSRDSTIAWKELLEEGVSFTLEYGWIADQNACPNDLFNGNGFKTKNALVIKSTEVVLLIISRWDVEIRASGEVDVTIHANENGDVMLRESRFADAAEAVIGSSVGSDENAARSLLRLISNLPQVTIQGRGQAVRLGDLFDDVFGPMIESAVKAFGYSGSPPLDLSIANFNSKAGRQAPAWGGRHMGGVTSIAEFLIPIAKLSELLSGHIASGRAMLLRNFMSIVVNMINDPYAWARPAPGQNVRIPNIAAKWETFRNKNGLTLSCVLFDRNAIKDHEDRLQPLAAGNQSRARIMQTLRAADVPVIEFGRAGTMIQDASFQVQPHSMIQSIQLETAEKGRKDRVETTAMPDVESRKGMAYPHDIIPASILEGEITMIGNFVLDTFRRVWVEFFGSKSISGLFSIISKSDTIEPGKFTSKFHLMSEGSDPLNTRKQLTAEEVSDAEKRAADLRKKK